MFPYVFETGGAPDTTVFSLKPNYLPASEEPVHPLQSSSRPLASTRAPAIGFGAARGE